MRPRLKSHEDLRLQQRAERLTRDLRDLASRYLGTKLLAPIIRFDLRGKSAGQVRMADEHTCLIRYNAQLLDRNPREFLSQTVPHETAHLVIFSLYGTHRPPHGPEWRSIMALFGASPERCHQYDVEGLQARRLRRFSYRCGCRTHELTSIRHNRIGAGQVYLCRQCGQPLRPVSGPGRG